MSVIVTGAAGLVGHAVRTRLAAAVVAPDRDARFFDGIEQVVCDVTDPVGLERIMSSLRVTAVVHCGAAAGPMVGSDDPRRVPRHRRRPGAGADGDARLLRGGRAPTCANPAESAWGPERCLDRTAPVRDERFRRR